MSVLVLMLYLVAGALHTFCDLDVAVAPTESIVTAVNSHDHARHSDGGMVAGHHCHGCFSVSVPAPLVIGAAVAAPRPLILSHDAVLGDTATGIDPPPPKFLA